MTVLDLRGGEQLVTPQQLVTPEEIAATGSLGEEAQRFSIARYLGLLALLGDALALVVIWAALSVAAGRSFDEVAYATVSLIALSAYGLHSRNFLRAPGSWFLTLARLTRALLAGSIASVVISAMVHRAAGVPQLGWSEAAAVAGSALVVIPGLRRLVSSAVRRQAGELSRVAVVGSTESAERVVRRLQRASGVELVGVVTEDEPSLSPSVRLLGGTLDLVDICERNGIDQVFVSAGGQSVGQLSEILRRLPRSVQVSIVPAFSGLLTWQSRVGDLDGLPVVDVRTVPLESARRVAKRAMDIFLSAGALICLAPVMLAIALVVKLTSSGPVLFRQTRIGYLGRSFSIVKFRTMDAGAEEAKSALLDIRDVDSRLFKIAVDPRVTAVGRFLRASSLDELPQLFNVLIGQMSLVGPRPLVPSESASFDGWATRRFGVKPGMTGLWQVSGRSDLPFEELCQLDYAYAASWSLSWDLKILLQTPATVLRGRGAY